MRIEVYGTPAPQGSKRAFAVRGKGGLPTGRVAVIESSHDRVKSWRQAVLEAARSAMAGAEGLPFSGPVLVRMAFYMPRPASHYGTGRNRGVLKPSAPARPCGTPDLSKLIRSTEDALSDAGVWTDDALAVDIRAAKLYASRFVPSGAVIQVTAMEYTGSDLAPLSERDRMEASA